MRPLLAPLLLGLLACAPTALHAQILNGVLLDAGSRAPLGGGVVTLLDRDSVQIAQARADTAGAFAFDLPGRGAYRLRADQPGYRTAASPRISIGANDTLTVEFNLAQDVVVLEPLVVTARNRRITPAARRFYDRAERGGFGSYITRAEIERTHPMRTTDLFHRIAGIQVYPIAGGNSVTIRGNCRPSVFVDGTRVNGYRSIDDLVQPLDVEGIEVYKSAHTAPAEYTGLRAGCAVVLIWTRIE